VTRQIRYDLAGIGSMVVDVIHQVPRVGGAHEKVLVETPGGELLVQQRVGGVTLNHLGWARVLGLRVAIFGKQAEDPHGRFLRDGMKRLGIGTHLDLSGQASSFAQVYVDPDGGRVIYMARGATGRVTPAEIDTLHRPVIDQSATVSTEVSQLPLRTVRRVLEVASEAGARTVLDLDVPLDDAVPALGTREDLEAVLRLADLVKPSLGATRGLVSSRDPEAVAREIARSFGAEAVVITTGAAGCVAQAGDASLSVPTIEVEAVDTTGAGDAFLGGLLAGLHYGLGWEDAARLGNACGTCCCEQVGAFPDDPDIARKRILEIYRAIGGSPFVIAAAEVGSAAPSNALERFVTVAAREVDGVVQGIDRAALHRAADLIVEAEAKGGRVHLTGVGKPEHAARYAAGLLSSIGTAATLLHATEAIHGSVGQLREGDVLIAISKSGETEELLACVSTARALGSRTIAVCGAASSPLAREADVVLPAAVSEEGGPLGLVPRASFLAETLVLQALSVLLQERKGLSREEYARRHPAGALGRRARGDRPR
jgi:arabinose-5-phosphate isomerase